MLKKSSILAALAAATALAMLALAATASASAPVIFTQELNQTVPVPNIPCTAYGYSFNTLSTFDVVRHYIQFYDDSNRYSHPDQSGMISLDAGKTVVRVQLPA
jgi:hypothetical protein